MMTLTRRQREIYEFLTQHAELFEQPLTHDQLCHRLGLRSRGSLHKHIRALTDAGLLEPMDGLQRGIRLTPLGEVEEEGLPFLGRIAAGPPLEAVTQAERIKVPDSLKGRGKPRYVIEVRGDSMIEDGILDGDLAVIEHASEASNGEIVVALIDSSEVTLKRLEQQPGRVILIPANASMKPMIYEPDQVQIQGVLRGLLRIYPS
ncbi:MAG: transcriptional repressor LexA [Candidatus Thiodiazotropha sp.]